jgi:hypothetical protein
MTIKRIGPLSCAKIAGVTYAALGLLIGALISLVAGLGLALSGAQQNLDAKAMPPMPAMFGAFMGVGAIIVFPILYGIIGFIFALIGAWIYNLLASWIGGIQVDIS